MRHFEMHHAGKLARQAGHAAGRPVRAMPLRPLGDQADDAGTVGPDDGHHQGCRGRRRLFGQHHRLAYHRRLRGEALVLLLGRNAAIAARVADGTAQQRQPHRRQRPLPQFARGLALLDEAPVLGCDGAGIPAVGQVVDRTASHRVAFEYGPLDCRNAAVARQQRWVIADAAQP